MGSSLSVVNDTDQRCNIRVYTVGRSFVVGTMNLQPGEKATRKLHKMHEDGERSDVHSEAEGVYFAKRKKIHLSEMLKRAEATATSTDIDEAEKEEEDSDSSEKDSPGFADSASIISHKQDYHEPTKDEGAPLPNHAVHANFPITPATLYQLAFHDSEFREWQRQRSQQNNSNFQETEWKKNEEGKESREISMTMKLSGPVGPSSTKCESVEIVEHYDEDGYIAVMGTTRMPGVPYGHSFHTETRTVFTWGKAGGTRMSVSFATVFDKSCMLKGVICKSSSSGQIDTNKKLVADIRQWIAEHSDKYLPQQSEANEDGQEAHSVMQQSIIEEGDPADEEEDDNTTEKALSRQGTQQDVKPIEWSIYHVVGALVLTNLLTLLLWLRA